MIDRCAHWKWDIVAGNQAMKLGGNFTTQCAVETTTTALPTTTTAPTTGFIVLQNKIFRNSFFLMF